MPHSATLHIRIDEKIKAQATETLAAMGLSVADAVRILLKRVVDEQAFPIELKVPNAETRVAIQESRALMKARTARFQTANDLFNDIEKTSQS